MSNNRRTLTQEDRMLENEIQRSTRVSSYLDNVFEALNTGNLEAAKANVPDYSDGRARQYRRGQGGGGGGLSHESGGLSMDMEGLFQSSADALGERGVSSAMSDAMPARADGQATFSGSAQPKTAQQAPRAGAMVSENQFRAIRKYPQIVEFLGTERGTKVANKILGEINTLIADQIEKNSQLVNEHAVACVAQKQYLHQFFKGEGWACKVTASGPFRGNEAFFFQQDEDKSFILRRVGDRYTDVSSEFNIVHDYRISEGDKNEE